METCVLANGDFVKLNTKYLKINNPNFIRRAFRVQDDTFCFIAHIV